LLRALGRLFFCGRRRATSSRKLGLCCAGENTDQKHNAQCCFHIFPLLPGVLFARPSSKTFRIFSPSLPLSPCEYTRTIRNFHTEYLKILLQSEMLRFPFRKEIPQ
jgi:hypothetical protein